MAHAAQPRLGGQNNALFVSALKRNTKEQPPGSSNNIAGCVSQKHSDGLKRNANPLYDFIASLDANWERAGEVYESIRQGLVSYFKSQQCPIPEELADEVVDRTARKFREAHDLSKFIRGIARRVCSEYFRQSKTVTINEVIESRLCADSHERDPDCEQALENLEKALGTLSPADREVVLEYYRFDGAAKITNRRRLAAALNTSVETLAVRVYRIRRTLRENWHLNFNEAKYERNCEQAS